jgi:hypothetical protein
MLYALGGFGRERSRRFNRIDFRSSLAFPLWRALKFKDILCKQHTKLQRVRMHQGVLVWKWARKFDEVP